MTTGIYYFSGTGNSLKVARDLADELKDAELISIAKTGGSVPNPEYEKIGIVFPVYMWGVPLIVSDFLKKLKNSKSYFFAVATYGGMPGAAIVQVSDLLKASGIKLSSGFAVRMPGNYTPMYGAIPEGKQKKMFEEAAKKVKTIAEFVISGKSNKLEKSFPIINWLLTNKFYSFAAPHIHEMDKRFRVDEKCTSCGICEKVCPVSDITLKNGKPVWHNRCQQCLACLQWCPAEAIQYGKSTEGRKRYRHPQSKVQDFIMR
jgi:ferredoxin